MSTINTPYDDVFRTLLNDCSSLIVPVINEVFGEHYTGEEKVVFSPNEHFLNRQDGEEEEKITDTSFQIQGKEAKKYHLECQSSADNSMLVRFFEYDTQIALDQGELEGNVLTVTFPHSAVLFLRSRKSTPEKMKIRMLTPGGCQEYDIPVMKTQNYTLDEILEKNLLFLIPFYIFTYEKNFKEYEENQELLEDLKAEYGKIRKHLEDLSEQGAISEYTKCTIMDMAGKVLEKIAENFGEVREGVKSVMGGKILEYEAKAIRSEGLREGRSVGLREGRNEGLREGRSEGRLQMLFDLVYDGVLPVADAAVKAKLTEEAFRQKMQTYRK